MLEDIYNFLALPENIFTGGMPTREQIADASQRGVELVINLAPHEVSNALPGETELVTSLVAARCARTDPARRRRTAPVTG